MRWGRQLRTILSLGVGSTDAAVVQRHDNTWLSLEDMKVDWRFRREYRPTYSFPGDAIDETHRSGFTAVNETGLIDLGVDGWLLPADAKKLYELEYFGRGDTLELGTYRGLSTGILLAARTASRREGRIHTVEIHEPFSKLAQQVLRGRTNANRIRFHVSDATSFLDACAAERRKFGFCFVDHSHAYQPMVDTCRRLGHVLAPGAFVLFHDFNDPRNADPSNQDYGVYEAIADALPKQLFSFFGIFGCSGLFRYRSAESP
ncbi:MAG: O-methyltransferase [Alphaproteobacteria bacterium]